MTSSVHRIELMKKRLLVSLSRCFKACFLEADGKTPTYEGARALEYMRKVAWMDRHSLVKDARGAIDPLALARIEGRRELYRDVMRMLKIDPETVGSFVEVDDGRG